jgi:hypothetical protein
MVQGLSPEAFHHSEFGGRWRKEIEEKQVIKKEKHQQHLDSRSIKKMF